MEAEGVASHEKLNKTDRHARYLWHQAIGAGELGEPVNFWGVCE
jgi:hypothetical protein